MRTTRPCVLLRLLICLARKPHRARPRERRRSKPQLQLVVCHPVGVARGLTAAEVSSLLRARTTPSDPRVKMLVRLSSLAAVRCASSLSRALVRRSASSPVSGVASFSTGRAVRSSSVLSNDLLLSVAMNSQAAQTARSQAEMCAQLRASGAIKSDRVADAIGRVDRRYFARPPAGLQQEAKEEEEEEEEDVSPYTHAPSPIGQLATISSPYSHALALEALESSGALQSATRVLDVGSGSGYLTACLALLADTRARVVALEHSGVLLAQSKLNLESEHDTAKLVARRPAEDAGISFVQGNAGDDALAWIERSPMREFDVVHVGVAFPRMPLHLLRLLRVGGRMLVPVGQAPPAGEGQQLLLVEKLSNLEEEGVGYHTTPIMACSYATIALE